MTEFRDVAGRITRQRAGCKMNIASALRGLHAMKDLKRDCFLRQEEAIKLWLAKIESFNTKIADECAEGGIDECDEHRQRDVDEECQFLLTTHDALATLALRVPEESDQGTPHERASEERVSDRGPGPLRPQLRCPVFSGKDLHNDKFGFKNFLSQFENCVAGVQSDTMKLQYLRGYLADYALQIVQHLTICWENYNTAIDLLKKEFLDREFIISKIFQQIDKAEPSADPEYIGVKQFLTCTRADLCELKCAYGYDFLDEDSPGNKYLAYSVFSKLPSQFKGELVRAVSTNYPSLNQILDNFNEVVQTLIIANPKAKPLKTKSVEWKPGKQDCVEEPEHYSTLENFATSEKTGFRLQHCRFCNADGHSMGQCRRYASLESRQARCAELRLCNLCARTGHQADECYGKSNKLYQCKMCSSRSHGSAMCPNLHK